MAHILRSLKSILDNFLCQEPLLLAAKTPVFCPLSLLGPLKTWEVSVYFAVPKKRRTIEQRRIRKFLSPNCYSKVREETNFLRSLINNQLPSDHEVQFVYDGDNTTNIAVNNEEVKVSGSRPLWFPSILRKSNSSGSENS
uniref:39S ribosomal protein L32, mitochondrial n=1 Tax=Schistosoma japonicum TaxID=6182 RepID=C1LGD8_SCHJA|nr:39S ribosomal protein L32, mitochondrial precursor [Schistosoma japonicum]